MLLKNAQVLLSMDDRNRRWRDDGAVLVEDGRIVAIGDALPPPEAVDRVIDLSHHVVMPGLVNTHHHMYQNLTRVVPAAQNAPLFGWLQTLYPIWARLRPASIGVSTELALAELLRSGCTTTSDHHYIFPDGCQLEHQIEAALASGVRFHAMRGSMSIGESDGGLPPDSLVEREADILKDSQRLIERWHDPNPGAMLRVGLAPCSPFSVSPALMRESAALARSHGVRLHTHLAENPEDLRYSRETFGQTPGEYVAELGWMGDDVWHAHCVQLSETDSAAFARTGTGISHCPCSNMRLGSGIAPVVRWREQGVRVGLGVDGSASNDSANLVGEARQALLLQRVALGADAMSTDDALRLATRGGAAVLGRDDIGQLAPGKAADIIAWRTDTLPFAGAGLDPAAALTLCEPGPVDFAMVNGEILIEDGAFCRVDLPDLLYRHAAETRYLMAG